MNSVGQNVQHFNTHFELSSEVAPQTSSKLIFWFTPSWNIFRLALIKKTWACGLSCTDGTRQQVLRYQKIIRNYHPPTGLWKHPEPAQKSFVVSLLCGCQREKMRAKSPHTFTHLSVGTHLDAAVYLYTVDGARYMLAVYTLITAYWQYIFYTRRVYHRE